MRMHGIEGLTPAQVEAGLAAGGRFVLYEYCISFLVVTLRCPSRAHYLRRGERGVVRGLPYALVSVLLGWWGVPWGIIYTPLTLVTNLSGGWDVSEAVWEAVCLPRDHPTPEPQPASPPSPARRGEGGDEA